MENLDFLSLSKNLQKLDSLQKNLIKNYYYGIYDRDTYFVLMRKLKAVNEEYNNLKSSENYTIARQNIVNKKLMDLSMEIGCNSLYDIIDNNYSEWFRTTYETIGDSNDINFYNNHFNCLSYKIYDKKSKEYDECYKVGKKIFVRLDNSIRYKKSLMERLNCAEIIIHILNNIRDEFLVIYGYFDYNNLATYQTNFSLGIKVIELKQKICEKSNNNSFKLNYFNIMSMRTLLIDNEEKIFDEIERMYAEYNKIKNRSNSQKVKDFLNGSLIVQRDMLNCLLCSDNEDDIMLANLLFDSINKTTEISRANPSAEELFKSMHFNNQEKLKDAYKTYENIKKKFTDDVENDIPYDKRIMLLNTSDSVKKKAFTKLKEMDGSRESGAKAQLFLDGLLKIPFGTYKKEPIFTNKEKYILELKNKIKTIKDLNKKIKGETENKSNIACYKFVSDLLDKYDDKIMYDSQIEQFLKHVLSTFVNLLEIITNDNNTLDKVSKYIYNNISETLNKLMSGWDSFIKEKTQYLDDVDNILNDAVYGHKHTKQELKRLIGQWINGKVEGNVIGLCGPPGIGKTSFAKRGLSKCLKDENGDSRPFAFLPIGGATNGSFLEGHGYTYLGSSWGKIVDILMETKCMNPIIFIDELDKVSNTEHGREIIGILTHITDPTQNNEYYDKFFQGIPIDLSKVLFVFSYNDKSLIDRILRDRIHEINIKALSKEEKLHITKLYTLPELYENIGFSNNDIVWDNNIIETLIDNYTYEAGIRKLNELLNEILREINLERIKNPEILPKTITKEFIEELFKDKPKSRPQAIHSSPKCGLVNGLYASASGLGGLTPIEVVKCFSDAKLHLELTGSQGDVMKESMKVAKTLAWNLIPDNIKKQIREDMELNGNFGLHIHCPDGATPKDGPSAGGAITVGIVSRLCNVRVKNNVCLTGEINLHGKFTAIGGLDAKLKGAEKAGCTMAIIPKENEEDYKNIIRDYKLNLEVKIVDNIHDVLQYALLEEDILNYNIKFNNI